MDGRRGEVMIGHCGKDLQKLWYDDLDCHVAMGFRVATMGLDVLSCLEKLHSLGFCHQDLKLENICFKNGQYTLIDFGCALRINHKKVKSKKPRGNTMFASIRQLTGRVIPQDDVESLLYVLTYCMDNFQLPWQKLKSGTTMQ
jgi:serine/threonine protein kinase